MLCHPFIVVGVVVAWSEPNSQRVDPGEVIFRLGGHDDRWMTATGDCVASPTGRVEQELRSFRQQGVGEQREEQQPHDGPDVHAASTPLGRE